MAADEIRQRVASDLEAMRAEGIAEGESRAAQAYFGQSAIRLTVGLFAAALREAAASMQAISPDAALFFAAKADEFGAFANPPQVVSISPAADAANVQPGDQVVLGFSAPLDPESVTTDTVTVGASSGGAKLAARVIYEGGTTVTIIPQNGFSNGVAYTVTVGRAVRSKVGQALGTDFTSSFTTVT